MYGPCLFDVTASLIDSKLARCEFVWSAWSRVVLYTRVHSRMPLGTARWQSVHPCRYNWSLGLASRMQHLMRSHRSSWRESTGHLLNAYAATKSQSKPGMMLFVLKHAAIGGL